MALVVIDHPFLFFPMRTCLFLSSSWILDAIQMDCIEQLFLWERTERRLVQHWTAEKSVAIHSIPITCTKIIISDSDVYALSNGQIHPQKTFSYTFSLLSLIRMKKSILLLPTVSHFPRGKIDTVDCWITLMRPHWRCQKRDIIFR